MATMELVDNELHVRFAPWERLAVWCAELVVPLAAVRKVECIDRPVAHARGGRAGFLISGVVKVGVWGLGTGVRRLVSVRRTVPALRVALDRAAHRGRCDELLISAENAAELAEAIIARRVAAG